MMKKIYRHAMVAVPAAFATLLLDALLVVAGVQVPLPLEVWFTGLPSLVVAAIGPSDGFVVLLVSSVLSVQHLALLLAIDAIRVPEGAQASV
jgi:hypothetical protein